MPTLLFHGRAVRSSAPLGRTLSRLGHVILLPSVYLGMALYMLVHMNLGLPYLKSVSGIDDLAWFCATEQWVGSILISHIMLK